MTNRRDFIKLLGASAGAFACRPTAQTRAAPTSTARGWDLVPEILARIVPPVFPDREFDITRYGARPDGDFDNSRAIARAIAACAGAGGGRVVVPVGRFVTGPIHLKSGVDLHIVRGGTLAFTRDTKAYLPAVLTTFESTHLMNYSPFIYARDQRNIAITGEGTLDGQANDGHWWFWKGSAEHGWKSGMPNYNASRQKLLAMAEQGVPVAQRVFGEGDYLRPNFIQPYRCQNVLIENVSLVNSPMWEINPVLCRNVTVRGVKIDSHGPNNDGVDPDSCRDVLIERCTFNTGDDCIAIKSGRNADGRRINVPSENIIVRNCDMRDGHGGVTVGSEISSGCWNVFAHDCRMDSPVLYSALRVKNNAMRGGRLHDIYMRDVTVGQVSQALLSIDFYYEEGTNGSFTPTARDIEMRNVTSRRSPYGVFLRGLPNAPIDDVRIVDCRFDGVEKGNVVENTKGLSFVRTKINGVDA